MTQFGYSHRFGSCANDRVETTLSGQFLVGDIESSRRTSLKKTAVLGRMTAVHAFQLKFIGLWSKRLVTILIDKNLLKNKSFNTQKKV
jgi:hypothetical protein